MEQILDIGEYGDKVRLDGGRIAIHRTDRIMKSSPFLLPYFYLHNHHFTYSSFAM